jgi:hypothetical protein
LPGTLTFNETATAYPTGDTIDGTVPVASGGDEQIATATTGIPSAHLLTGTIITNTNSTAQEMVLNFDDNNPAHWWDAFAQIIVTNAQGQQGNVTSDAGFNVLGTDHFNVALDTPFETSKIIVTNFTLNGVTMQESHGNIQLDYNDGNGGVDGFAAIMQPNGTTPVTGQDAAIGTSGNNVLTDSASSFNILYGDAGNDTLAGSATADTLLNGGSGSDNVTGGPNLQNIVVYDPADASENGGLNGNNILRIDQGAIFNTSQEFPTSGLSDGLLTATVNLTGAPGHLSNFEGILLTEEALASPTLGTQLVLDAAAVAAIAPANASDGGAHDLYIMGNSGDNIQLTDFASWTDTHTTVTPVPGGATFTEWTAVSGATTVHLFVDNALGHQLLNAGAPVHA